MHANVAVRFAFAAGLALGLTAQRAYAQSESQTQPQAQPQTQPDIRSEMKQEVDRDAATAGKKIDELRAVRLTVKEVDRAQHKVTFEAQVSPEASFQTGKGTPIKLDQLEEGDEVRAAFDPATGEVMAVQVLTAEDRAAGEEPKTTKPSKK